VEKHLVEAGGSQWARGVERSPSAMIVPHDHVVMCRKSGMI
jgi:hypothetical protein